MKPLCFVAMPFGQKKDGSGNIVDFDAVYAELIKPAIEAAELEPIRADEESVGGVIHKPMFERLILCDYAVADLTTANANVFYELGVRHAVRPHTTIMIFATGREQLPFDVAPLRGLPYALGADGKPASAETDRAALAERLRLAREGSEDSPVYQLVDDYPGVAHRTPGEVDHTKTDVFRKQVAYAADKKQELARARGDGAEAVKAVAAALGPTEDIEAGVVIDLFLSYRAVKAWPEMIDLVANMRPELAATVMVQEQLGLALNRAGRGEDAERTLSALIKKRGPSSETYGILGRVYKDRWETAKTAGNAALARGLLRKAIDAYKQGFEADSRDAYPGVNAVTLMELSDPPNEASKTLLPVVRYAVERKIAAGEPDYWDHATLLELAVLARDQDGASDALADALAVVREVWEPETTARNLRLIREAREARGEDQAWVKEIEMALDGAGQ